MFFGVILASLVIGVVSVNALAVPVAYSLVPEPGSKFPQSFSTLSYRDLNSSL